MLLVDDKEDHFIMTRRLFTGMKRGEYELEWMPTFEKGLEAISQVRHDAYLIDHHLGLKSGLDLIQQARAMGCRAPMILFTSGEDPNADLEALRLGATDYLAKGRVDAPLLERTIHYAIQHTRQLDALRTSEEALRASEERLSIAIDAAEMGTVDWNITTNSVSYGGNFERLFGFDPAHPPRTFEDVQALLHPEDRQYVEQTLIRSAQAATHFDMEFRLLPQDGMERWLAAQGEVYCATDGTPKRMSGVVYDITARRRAEAALRESEERLRIAIDAAQIGTVEWDIPSNGITFGGHLDLVMGVDLKNAPPTSDGIRPPDTFEGLAQYIHPDDREYVKQAMYQSAQNGTRFDLEFRLLYQNMPSERWLASQGEVFCDRNGTPIRASGVMQDITERKLIEQERARVLEREQEARRISEEANEMKLRFLAMVSHELRTPLTSIKGFTSTLLADDVTWTLEQYQEYVDIIDRETDKLTDLVAQLMDVSRLQAGVMPIQSEPHSLTTIIRGALPQLEAATHSHHIDVSLPDDLPLVICDRRRTEQVIVNLVENAAKYSKAGTQIWVTAQAQGEMVEVSVEDQGQGIPPEDRERVFEAFQQLGAAHKGAGLGLAICKGLIEAQGGQIWIADKPAPGTRVAFTLTTAQEQA